MTSPGTYDSFIELALGDLIAAQFARRGGIDDNTHLRTPGDVYVASPNDNAIIQGVGGLPDLARLRRPGLRRGERRHGQDPRRRRRRGLRRARATETVADGTYPISRPLFIYPSLTQAAENPAIVGYVDYYLSDEGIANVTERRLRRPAGRGAGGDARSRGRPPSRRTT